MAVTQSEKMEYIYTRKIRITKGGEKKEIVVNEVTAKIIDYLNSLERCLGIKLCILDRIIGVDKYPVFHLATSKYDSDIECLDIYYSNNEWVVGLGKGLALNFHCMVDLLSALLGYLNYQANEVDFDAIKTVFGVEDDND